MADGGFCRGTAAGTQRVPHMGGQLHAWEPLGAASRASPTLAFKIAEKVWSSLFATGTGRALKGADVEASDATKYLLHESRYPCVKKCIVEKVSQHTHKLVLYLAHETHTRVGRSTARTRGLVITRAEVGRVADMQRRKRRWWRPEAARDRLSRPRSGDDTIQHRG